ncbi:MAG: anaerobic ribonucleoside-triphosphate reductase activating protein [Candidatus Woesearchaeota archaeon]|nr:anaerobic ribonucleoside-triphosphate reductase activating protein [Candidatus Woesearchaeota archaeon]
MVLIKGLQKTTLVDYPGKMACAVFLAGCNFRCHYCHNPDLIEKSRYDNQKTITEAEFFGFLESKMKWLDGVVITGGEPCMNNDLFKFMKKIKEMGFPVKLDTNGSFPGMLRYIIDNDLVDYIAMDVKAPLEKYEKVISAKVNADALRSSIDAVKKAGKGEKGIDYEFRITVVPTLHTKDDLRKIGELLKGSKKIVLQQFSNKIVYDPEFSSIKPYSKAEINEFREMLTPYSGEVEVR